MDVVIAGGGMVGIATSIFLARRGHEVLVLERDGGPPEAGPEEDFERWPRPGVPQAVHSHTFLARSTRVLREEAPDVVAALVERGVVPSGRSFGAGYEADTDLQGRRPVYEAVLRRTAQRESRIEIRAGVQLGGLTVATTGGRRRITGVRLDDGEVCTGDVVIDALGRRSPTPRWLRELGVAPPSEEHHECGLHYFARHYRVREGARLPQLVLPLAELTPYALFLAFGGDNGTFSLAGGLSVGDPHRAVFRDAEVFDRVLGSIPSFQPFLAAADPITDVHLMGSLANRRRRLVEAGEPRVDGYALVGDASIYTNATFGQGVSLGLWQAQAIARLIGEVEDPARDLAVTLEAWTDEVLGPRFDQQARSDARQAAQLRDGLTGAPLPEPSAASLPAVAASRLAAEEDPVVAPVWHRARNLLADPADVVADTAVRTRIQEFLATGPSLSPRHGPLERRDFERLVTG